MNKYRASKAKEARLTKELSEERQKQAALLVELQNCVSEATGQVVKIGGVAPAVAKVPQNAGYDRNIVVARIVELRDGEKLSFDAIASKLNAEGFTPRTAKSFKSATVYRLYEDHKGKAAGAAA